ncbi:MAG: hypothetical protein HY588_02865 [Candidatus Omnitrophica bacterium]|nr:hypothetical protein [Candidatus Omnitrophota bacterium]
MMSSLLHSIVEGKQWSWSLVGLAVILLGLLIRSILLRDILRGIKIRNRSWYRRAQAHYQERALLGWVFFALFAVGAMLLWRFDTFLLRYLSLLQWVLILAALLVSALFCHLRAYARAIVDAVQENVATDKDI